MPQSSRAWRRGSSTGPRRSCTSRARTSSARTRPHLRRTIQARQACSWGYLPDRRTYRLRTRGTHWPRGPANSGPSGTVLQPFWPLRWLRNPPRHESRFRGRRSQLGRGRSSLRPSLRRTSRLDKIRKQKRPDLRFCQAGTPQASTRRRLPQKSRAWRRGSSTGPHRSCRYHARTSSLPTRPPCPRSVRVWLDRTDPPCWTGRRYRASIECSPCRPPRGSSCPWSTPPPSWPPSQPVRNKFTAPSLRRPPRHRRWRGCAVSHRIAARDL